MADIRVGDNWYVTTSDSSLSMTPARITSIIISPTAGASAPTATIADPNNQDQVVLNLRCPTTESKIFIFAKDDPFILPSGIKVTAMSDCTLTFKLLAKGA